MMIRLRILSLFLVFLFVAPPAVAVYSNVVIWFVSAPFLYHYWSAPNPDSMLLFVHLFPAAGLVVGGLALKRMAHRWTYGTSTLVMDTMPGRLGDRLEARLQTSIPYSEAPDEGFHVRLFCGRRSKGSDTSSPTIHTKWENDARVCGQPSAEGDGVEVPVSFELPADLPPSTPEKSGERILWRVEVSAEMKGLDYDATVEIPVFEPEESSR